MSGAKRTAKAKKFPSRALIRDIGAESSGVRRTSGSRAGHLSPVRSGRVGFTCAPLYTERVAHMKDTILRGRGSCWDVANFASCAPVTVLGSVDRGEQPGEPHC